MYVRKNDIQEPAWRPTGNGLLNTKQSPPIEPRLGAVDISGSSNMPSAAPMVIVGVALLAWWWFKKPKGKK